MRIKSDMTEQKKGPSEEGAASPNAILSDLTVEQLKQELINQWNKKVDIPSSDVFLFLVDQLAETTAQNYALCSQVLEFQTGYTELAKANLNRKKELVSISFKLNDLIDRVAAAGL